MGLPGWWEERRFGIMFEPSVAAVPGWAPIGEDAVSYRSHLGQAPAADGTSAPLIEVLAHHRDRWGHIDDYDDFVELLDFAQFDPDAWAQLAADAGAGYAGTVARHHDGWRWWAAPDTDLVVGDHGVEHDVVEEFARACTESGLTFGVLYSALDRTAEHDARRSALAVARHELIDLIDRHHPAFVRLHTAADDPFAGSVVTRVQDHDPTVVVDAPSGAASIGSGSTVERVEWAPPPAIVDDRPWELRRGLGSGYGYNRAERDEHLLSPDDLVALLTEVVAKGGHLLLSVGVAADGVVPTAQARTLRAAGAWIRRHRDVIDRGRPWRVWGDTEVRYIVIDDGVQVVDVTGRGRFAALRRGICQVDAVSLDGVPVPFVQDEESLRVDVRRSSFVRRADARDDVAIDVYTVRVSDVPAPAQLFPAVSPEPIDLVPVLAGTAPGTVVQLGDGRYVGRVDVPAGVTLRGLGPGRTQIEFDGGTLTLAAQARLEHVGVRSTADDEQPMPVVVAVGDGVTILGCVASGRVEVRGDDVALRATRVAGADVIGADRVTIARCEVEGVVGTTGITIDGGDGHSIESCVVVGHEDAVTLAATSAATVRGNDLAARRSGIRLQHTTATHVRGNFVRRTMRGIDIDGGHQVTVEGNAVCDGDSGCLVQAGATDVVVTGNTWERCRVGVLLWDVADVGVVDNEAIDLHDTELLSGP